MQSVSSRIWTRITVSISYDDNHYTTGTETINHIISECSKLVQKEYKTRHDWGGKVIHWELCKKMKFDHPRKWYMYKPESILKNEAHKIIWDFEIQTNQLISARRLDRDNQPKDKKKKKKKKGKKKKLVV